MIPLQITIDIEKNPWEDLKDKDTYPGMGRIERIGRLPRGTVEGKATVGLLVKMPDGKLIIAETTLALMAAALKTLSAVDERPEEN